MQVPFLKMQATGNDFILIDARSGLGQPNLAELSRQIADRHFGVGSDQVLYHFSAQTADARMVVYNADGSVAEMSGNGMRCFAKYLFEHQHVQKPHMTVETMAGTRIATVLKEPDGLSTQVQVDMGQAQYFGRVKLAHPEFARWHRAHLLETQDLKPDEIWLHVVSVGNPHAVLFVDAVDAVPLSIWGPVIETHPYFPNRTNVEIIAHTPGNDVLQRTWERGAGETLACGTGACAVAKTVFEHNRQSFPMTIHLRGGALSISNDPQTQHVLQTGPALMICSGEFWFR